MACAILTSDQSRGCPAQDDGTEVREPERLDYMERATIYVAHAAPNLGNSWTTVTRRHITKLATFRLCGRLHRLKMFTTESQRSQRLRIMRCDCEFFDRTPSSFCRGGSVPQSVTALRAVAGTVAGQSRLLQGLLRGLSVGGGSVPRSLTACYQKSVLPGFQRNICFSRIKSQRASPRCVSDANNSCQAVSKATR
jgi:hypothetical protein